MAPLKAGAEVGGAIPVDGAHAAKTEAHAAAISVFNQFSMGLPPMAITADKVVTILEAKTEAYNAKIANSAKQFEARMAKISAAAEKAGRATSLIGTNAAFDRFAPQAGAVASSLTRIGSEGRVAEQSVRNLAFQFQDIGTMLAAGQSPFMLLAQQLPQVTMYGGSLNGVMGALRGTIASLFSPLGLATTAFVLLGSAAVSYFSDLLSQGESAEESLKRQEELIHAVADRWGDAIPAIKEYSEELRRQAELAELSAAAQKTLEKQLSEIEDDLDSLVNTASDLSEELGEVSESISGNEVAAEFGAIYLAIKEYSQAARDGTDASDEFSRVMQLLTDVMGSDFVQGNNTAIKSLETLRDAFLNTAKAAEALQAQKAAVEANRSRSPGNQTQGRLTGNELSDLEFRRRFEGDNFGGLFETTEPRGSSGRAGSRATSISEIERERQAVVDLIDQLEFEQSLIGMTAVEREKATALRRAGSAATDQQREKISQLVETTYNENAALQAQQQAYQQLEQIGMNAINSIANAFKDGKLEANEMIGIVVQLIQQLMTMQSLGGGLGFFGGGTFGLFPGGFGFGGGQNLLWDKGGYTGPGGKHQPAGVVHKGEYVFSKAAVDRIGAGNREAMHRNLKGYAEGGFVAPSAPVMQSTSQASGNVYAPEYNIDARGAEAGVEKKITAALKEYDKGNYQRFLANMGNARKRNAI